MQLVKPLLFVPGAACVQLSVVRTQQAAVQAALAQTVRRSPRTSAPKAAWLHHWEMHAFGPHSTGNAQRPTLLWMLAMQMALSGGTKSW